MKSFEPTKVLVAGDVHGNARWMGSLCKLARRHGCDAILQVGDFGYWPHTEDGCRFLEQVQWHAERNEIGCVYWIDGNHENHALLADCLREPDGTVSINDRCRYLPRGLRWSWGGIRFGALGGAFSVDWRNRIEGESWWPEEIPTADDVARLGDEPLDVLVTHDAPAGIGLKGLRLAAEDQVRADEVRRRIRSAVEATQPQLVLHGHWHHRHSQELTWPVRGGDDLIWRSTQVEGLASDIQRDHRAWVILELNPLRLIDTSEVRNN